MVINSLFNLLDDWRFLPSYQLERRADIFFGLHLEAILKEKLGEDKLNLIIPEFPVRKGSLPQDPLYNIDPKIGKNQSFKIDYLAYSKSQNIVYFIELKTDLGSRNSKQDWYLKEAKNLGMYQVLEDLKPIYKASNKNGRIKYEHLFKKLCENGLTKGSNSSFEIVETDIKDEIIYIQPTSDIIDNSIITFRDIINNLKNDSNTEFTKRFLKSLIEWQSECAK